MLIFIITYKVQLLISVSVLEQDDRGDGESCGCLRSCREISYPIELSYLQYPSDKAGKIMKTLFGRNVTYMR